MASPTFSNPLAAVKSLAAAALVTAWAAGPATAQSALTPSMQLCLSVSLVEAQRTLGSAKRKAMLHASDESDEVVMAMATALDEFLKRECDVRPDELSTARKYLVAEEAKRAAAEKARRAELSEPAPAPAPVTKRSGPKETPTCVGNCR